MDEFFSAILSSNEKRDAMIKEQFELLKKVVESKMRLFEESIENMSADPAVPDKVIIRHSRYDFDVSEEAGEFFDKVTGVIDSLFPSLAGTRKVKGAEALKELVTSG